ncbi:MAG: alpha/beta fold hydrolase [Bryobacteraceae bacterium]|jgi:predicted alpha/beta-hydrolase family hydrolase
MHETFDRNGIRGVLHRPAEPSGDGLVLTHGAGSDHRSPLLAAVAEAFEDAGCLVLRFDLPFRRERPKGPPHPAGAARDRAGVAEAASLLRPLGCARVVAGGHSYGGRQTAMAAAETPAFAESLLLLSYPLHPPGKPEQLRTAFFPQLRTPALFVHGAADPFGTLAELRASLSLIPVRTELLSILSAGHDLKAIVRQPDTVADAFRRFFPPRHGVAL